jgi:Domain of unknown function (DUF4157)
MSSHAYEIAKPVLQRQTGNVAEARQSLSLVNDVLRSPGVPLDAGTQKYFASRLGHDFSRVRIHADARASQSAETIDALAYTRGPHIVFQSPHYDVNSVNGRRLMAHELVHVIQQGQTQLASSDFEISSPGDRLEFEADAIADRVVAEATVQKAIPTSRAQRSVLQRQPRGRQPAAGTCPTGVTLSTGRDDVHVPLCGIPNVRATTVPANIPGISWSLVAGTAQIATGTRIDATGVITFGAAQGGGTMNVTATQPATATAGSCDSFEQLRLHSHPIAISNTFIVGPAAAGLYGAAFDHDFTSADGNTTSLQFVKVGEEFSGVPNPTANTHRITGTPFGTFDLTTRSLTPNGTNTWSIDNGQLAGNHDTVTIERSIVNVGNFVASASNPAPTVSLPASFTLTQGLFWFCRQAAPGSRWSRIRDVDHVRTLRLNGSDVEFVVTVNGLDNVDTYTGHPAFIHAHATPATIPPTPPRTRRGPAPTPSTTTISADTLPDPLPARHRVRFSIRGNALGSRINANTGVFTAGQNTGTVTVRVSDAVTNPNFDEVAVTIANPAQQPAPQPGQPPPGQQPGQPPGQQPAQPPPGQQPAQPPPGQQAQPPQGPQLEE